MNIQYRRERELRKENKMDLKKIRLELGKSQIDMASEIGVSLNTYTLWERNAGNPSEENEVKLKETIERLRQQK